MNNRQNDKNAEGPRGIERSFAVLEYIANRPSRVVDVTRELGLPWATVHRTITQLEKAQFLRRDPATNRFEIGPRLWHLGSAYLASNQTLKSSLRYLSREHSIADVTIQVVERMGYQTVVTHAEERQAEEITKASYGYHFPLHCGSKGWVLLAYSDPDFIESYLSRDLERLTAKTITDPDELRKELQATRKNGYAITEGDVQLFTGSMAAPVFEASGSATACICFVYMKEIAADHGRIDNLLQSLLKMADTISHDLGWSPGRA